MRKNIAALALILTAIGIIVIISAVHAAASASKNTVGSSSSTTVMQKSYPTYPSYPTTNKHTTPVPTVGSCPGPLPQPGVIHIAMQDSEPTYYFLNEAIVVSNGKAYYIMGGSLRGNAKQGIIAIEPIPSDPCQQLVNELHGTPTPSKLIRNMPSLHGAITITGVSSVGTTVSFQAEDGTTGHFDYGAQTFAP